MHQGSNKKNLYAFLSAVVAALLAGCIALEPQPVASSELANIRLTENTLSFDGPLTERTVAKAMALAEQSEIKIQKLAINSGGGDVNAAMEFGYWIYRNQLDLIVKEVCFSSCANYLFTAAKSRYVNSDAIVGWHGGALAKPAISYDWITYLTPRRWYTVDQAIQRDLEEWLQKETEFFHTIGIDQKITVYGQQKKSNCQESEGTMGWSYSLDDLESMGLKNTAFADGAPDFSSPRAKALVCLETLTEV
jgi:hypothetical protein